ncbi:hypothetical protein TeGR_g5121 [Tetraparma gracilis]|uniref:Uncharacterized protein n=1 Tax=Tetraparma gracilis TaxID=2962635 RepID=A0ABQ6NBJ7_9STRA|nr:hypothetical protein TeGR_g5121 [Tetraparma gracilis]
MAAPIPPCCVAAPSPAPSMATGTLLSPPSASRNSLANFSSPRALALRHVTVSTPNGVGTGTKEWSS